MCIIQHYNSIFSFYKSFFIRISVWLRSQILFKPKLDAIILSQVLPSAMFLHLNIIFLVLTCFLSDISCGYINSTTNGTQKTGRKGRFFGLFNIVSFRDDECNSTTTGVQGTFVYQQSQIDYVLIDIHHVQEFVCWPRPALTGGTWPWVAAPWALVSAASVSSPDPEYEIRSNNQAIFTFPDLEYMTYRTGD